MPQAAAAPSEQGGTEAPGAEQGGTLTAPSGEQGGTSPAPEPAPEPVAPAYTPGPGLVPGPPPGEYQQPQEPQYQNSYSPPQVPLQPRQDVAPIKRIAPKTDQRGKATEVRAGNYSIPVAALPDIPQRDRAVNSLNDWFAYGEAKIATELVARGVPEDEASRQAAAAIAGAAAAGVIGGTVTFVGSAVVIGTVVIPIATLTGAAIGSTMGPQTTGPGALTGLAVGTAVTLAAAGSLGVGAAILSALIGGGLGWALGAGDPGQTVDRPDLPWEQQRPGKHRAPDTSDPSNQFVAVAGPSTAPAASYVVAESGDVSMSAQIGGQTVTVGWTAEQAAAPVKALGPAAPAAQRVVDDVTETVTSAIRNLPGTTVKWGAPTSGNKR
ncbi:hypothetical protein [Gordonia sp. (in: high G+C Gram-positive bacteria)]|uniref:hypothetical protein n=1 Tax=Gordonia sp. (in: high G+C Gram-positive bacteria) TaxID=84139 RepID=UPI003C75CA6E